jgi:hypothetical protein
MPYINQWERDLVFSRTRVMSLGQLNYKLSKTIHNYVELHKLNYDMIVFVEKALHRTVENCLGIKHTKEPSTLEVELTQILIENDNFDAEDRLITLSLVGAEFYRTVAAPYEDRKRSENGSVSNLDGVTYEDGLRNPKEEK